MVTCNICRCNLPVEEMEERFICKSCSERMNYCQCAIYLSGGDNKCAFCNLPMRPIKVRK